MRGIVWFREDLRVCDNTALHQAAKKCKEGLIAIYFIDAGLWKKHHVAAVRVDFLLRGLIALKHALHQINIPLLIRTVSHTETIRTELYKIIEAFKVNAVFFNHQHEVNELRRDQIVFGYLNTKKIKCYGFDDQTILPPGRVLTKENDYFSIFTPYKRAWYHYFIEQNGITLLPLPKKQVLLDIPSDDIPLTIPGFESSIDNTLWPASEEEAHKRLDDFVNKKLFLYAAERDYPALNGTSRLSPYLASGMISARECFLTAMFANSNELATGNPGAVMWMNELIWRDFYKEILIAVPRISMNKAFKPETENLPWRYNEAQLFAWKEGKTGFPIIDAAMRQLKRIGWMHNRLRMIVAMFFTKNLFFDWRIGETYFMSQLIDGDFSANNGGWQWSASTGTDAAPYFRIFNPIRQSERFDPNGDFIREYCPELHKLNKKEIHHPPGWVNYLKPIVNLELSRKQAIAAFKSLMAK
jgi:deoxyribodipyrimidine photo-lyase